jgi:hypothetical protein
VIAGTYATRNPCSTVRESRLDSHVTGRFPRVSWDTARDSHALLGQQSSISQLKLIDHIHTLRSPSRPALRHDHPHQHSRRVCIWLCRPLLATWPRATKHLRQSVLNSLSGPTRDVFNALLLQISTDMASELSWAGLPATGSKSGTSAQKNSSLSSGSKSRSRAQPRRPPHETVRIWEHG